MEIQKRARMGVLFSILLAAALGAGGTRVATALEIGKPAPDWARVRDGGKRVCTARRVFDGARVGT